MHSKQHFTLRQILANFQMSNFISKIINAEENIKANQETKAEREIKTEREIKVEWTNDGWTKT